MMQRTVRTKLRSYNRVVSVLESHSNLVTKLFNEESSRELTMQVFHLLVAGEQKEDIEERTLDSAENISPNEMSSYPCDGIVSSFTLTMNLAIAKRGLKYQSLSFALSVFMRRLIERYFETMAEITQRIKTDLIGNLCNLHFWIFL